MANNMIWDPVNRMRDEDWIDTDGSRISDVLQLEENSEVVKDLLEAGHAGGAHAGEPISSLASIVPSASSGALTNTVGANSGSVISAAFAVTAHGVPPNSLYFVIPSVLPEVGAGGRIESGVSYVEPAGGPSMTNATNQAVRRATGALTTTRRYSADSSDPGPGDYGVALTIPPRMDGVDGFPICRNHYDSIYEALAALRTKILREHSGEGDPTYQLMSLKGAELTLVGEQEFAYAAGGVASYEIGPHGGEYLFVVCAASPLVTGALGSNPHILVGPVFDDTTVYLGVRTLQVASSADVERSTAYFGAITVPITSQSPDPAGTWPEKTTKAVVDGVDPDDWTALVERVEYLEELFAVSHENDGRNQLAITTLTGWTVVQTAWAIVVGSAIGDITETLIEADPGPSVLYLASLIGSAGSGQVMVTVSRSETEAYLCTCRITLGTTNNFTACVARFTRS